VLVAEGEVLLSLGERLSGVLDPLGGQPVQAAARPSGLGRIGILPTWR
jgi:hypothetical protein